MGIFFALARFQISQILVFGGFFLGVYYFTLYNDGSKIKESIKNTKSKIQGTEAQIKKTKEELEQLEIFKNEISKQKEIVEVLLNFIPSYLTFSDISALVIRQATLTGVNIESKKDGPFKPLKDTDYEVLNMELEITGSFSQLMSFLSKLTDQTRILIVHKININVKENSLISANISLLSYRYNKKEEKEEKDNA